VYKLRYWNTLPSFKTTPKGYPQFWGPGNAWVLGGLVRSLKYMPQNSKYRPAWEATFKTFCDTLRIKQQPDGFWRTSLFEPTEFPNPESSCTSFFIYAMSLGVQWGILDANTFVPVIRKGWSALVKVVTAAGMVGYGQSWSNQPGSPYNWTAIPEGHGAFLLAGEGVSIIVGLPTGSLPLPSQTRVSRTPVWGIGTLMIVSGGRKTVRVAAGSNGLEVYDARGARLWRCDASGGADISLPERIARGGVYYVKFLK
jgi:hypothetical protein